MKKFIILAIIFIIAVSPISFITDYVKNLTFEEIKNIVINGYNLLKNLFK